MKAKDYKSITEILKKNTIKSFMTLKTLKMYY
jgi:hypothetical protein